MNDQVPLPLYLLGEPLAAESDGLAQWRSSVETLFDVEPIEQPFNAQIESYSLGEMLFGASRSTAQRFIRDERVVRRSGVDHLLVQLYVHGGFDCTIDGTTHSVREGDISILDLSRTFSSESIAFDNLNLVVPRHLLGLMPGDTTLHGTVLPARAMPARLLAAHLLTLADMCRTAQVEDQGALVSSTVGLLESAIGPHRRTEQLPKESDRSQLAEMCRFIEANIIDVNLSVDRLVGTFAASRATIYRMFKSRGGIATHIRKRRLELVCQAMADNSSVVERLDTLARRFGFRSEDAFARSFKEEFGISPMAWRRQLLLSKQGQGPSGSKSGDGLSQWIRSVGT